MAPAIMNFRTRYILLLLLCAFALLYYWKMPATDDYDTDNRIQAPVVSADGLVDAHAPFIFIGLMINSYRNKTFLGGIPRSGTTLMRAMLDAHPMIRW